MKHDSIASLHAVLAWLDRKPTPVSLERCRTYAELLVTEGIPAGAIGPNEADRIWSRHVADSVCFAAVARGDDWLDVGTGAGLPGIPIACCFPETRVTLLDRSGRRVDLLRRWVRILELDNVDIVESDIGHYTIQHDIVCFRGSQRLEPAIATTHRLASVAGVFGLSHAGGESADLDAATVDLVDVVVVPPSVLDTGVTLLRITV